MNHGHPNKDSFKKAPRETSSEMVMRIAKKMNVPAPTTYKDFPKHKIQNVPKSTTGQMLMNDDCKYKSMQTPGAKYDTQKGYDYTHDRVFKLKIIPDKNADKNKYKIVKSKLPDMGSYKVNEAINKLRPDTDFKVFIGKSPKKSFLDGHVKLKKINPPPGHYPLDKLANAWNRISSSPNSIRVKRH